MEREIKMSKSSLRYQLLHTVIPNEKMELLHTKLAPLCRVAGANLSRVQSVSRP